MIFTNEVSSRLVFSLAAFSWTAYLILKWMSKREGSTAKTDAKSTDMPKLSREQVSEFFFSANEKITKTMILVEQQLAQYKGQIPQEQLAGVMVQQFEEQLQEYQDAMLAKWNCTEEDLKIAKIYFQNDPDVKQGVNRLINMYKAVSLEVIDDIPDDLNEDIFAEALVEYYETATSVMKNIIEQTQSMQQSSDKSKWLEEVMRRFQREQDISCGKVLEKYGMHNEMMSAALSKFSDSKKIANTFTQCQQKQQEEFARLGLV